MSPLAPNSDQKTVEEMIARLPTSLHPLPPVSEREDHVAHMLKLIEMGYTRLAADHLLFASSPRLLRELVSGLVRQLDIRHFAARILPSDNLTEQERKVALRHYLYETLLEIGLNFLGLESRHLPEREKEQCLIHIREILRQWEERERNEGGPSVALATVREMLSDMKLVMQGASMQARIASEIEQELFDRPPFTCTFLQRAGASIQRNIYYQLVRKEKCRFGNDYALGLRWLRHLGFEQVSTNPVLAARAYQDDPRLGQIFRERAASDPRHEKWCQEPSRYGDEIALYATLVALWENLYVFRPIFYNLREGSGGGVVSFQLNPNIAHLADESVTDALSAFQMAEDELRRYDAHLLAGYGMHWEQARPNMVIKVAASSPAACEITRTLNSLGVGTNITVVFTVAQEVTLILEEMEGMAWALKKGITPTQLYMTNMGGRLESHLREVKLEELFGRLRDHSGEDQALQAVARLADANGTRAKVDAAPDYEEKVKVATRFLHGQRKIDDPVIEALQPVAGRDELEKWEKAISQAGTAVARRVWGIFFPRENRRKWAAYLQEKYDLSRSQAYLIQDRICYLPASKRKAEDTFWTLSSTNMVHTEFPNQQEAVRQMASKDDFQSWRYYESIRQETPNWVLELLNEMEDFRQAYELNEELISVLARVGIKGDFGSSGLKPYQWSEYGAVIKTLEEFRAAYDQFKQDMVRLLQS